jgi:DNA-directed RNA polymerase specialized sigma24 family protein
VLAEAYQILSGMDFGPNRHRLDEVLEVIRAVIVRRARADGRSQDEVGELLGVSQQTVSTILNTRPELRGWRTALEGLDEPD